MANWKDYWKNTARGGREFSLGPAPYTQSGFRRDPILGEILDPAGADRHRAEQGRHNLDLKEGALGLPKIDDAPWYKKYLAYPALSAVGWLGHQIDRPFNALEGILEETRDQALAKDAPLGPLETLKAAGKGGWQGLTQQKDYNAGRWIEKLAPESEAWQTISRARPLRVVGDPILEKMGIIDPTENIHNKVGLEGTEAGWGKSGPQTDPEYSGIRNMTNADILGLVMNFKSSVFPAKLGRVAVGGKTSQVVDEAATAAANAGKKFKVTKGLYGVRGGVADAMRDVVESPTVQKLPARKYSISGMRGAGETPNLDYLNELSAARRAGSPLDDILPPTTKPANAPKLADPFESTFSVPRGTPNLKLKGPAKADPVMRTITEGSPEMRRAFLLAGDSAYRGVTNLDDLDPINRMLVGAQLEGFDKVGKGAKDFLAKTPGIERALSHFSNRVESSATEGASQMFDDIDNARLGYKASNTNFDARMVDALRSSGLENLTDNQKTALYFATVTGKSLDDPALIQSLATHYKMPVEELQGLTNLEPLRQWWLREAGDYATKGEAAGFFTKLDRDYMPIRFKREMSESMMDGADELLGQEFGGLRGIQKNREFNLDKDWEKLIQAGAQGELAFDKFDEASQFYSRVFHGLERRRNLLESLEKRGLVSRTKKDGFDTLADVFDVSPTAVPRGTGSKLGMPIPKNPKYAAQAEAAATGSSISADQYFINSRVKQRFVDELFGYGGKRSPILQGLSKIQDPWKAAVTTLNPRYHVNNMIDDLVRNKVLGDVDNGAYRAAVQRTDDVWAQGVQVDDWVKNAQGQWEFAPGASGVMDLTEREVWDLANKMGMSTVETSEIANQGKSAVRRFIDRTERVQGVSREANFMSNLKNTGNSKFAKQIGDQDLINYRDISPFMRDVVRPFAPFSTFRTKNPGVALNQLLMNPTKFGRFGQLKEATEQELQEQTPEYLQEHDGGQAHLPKYYRGKPVVAWKDGDATSILDVGLSQFDFENLISPNAMGTSLRRLPGPALQIPLGLMTGKNSLGQSIEGPQQSGWIDGLLFGQEAGDGKTYTDGRTKFLVDSLAGQVNRYHQQGNNLQQDIAGQVGTKRYNTERLILQALLEQNRERSGRLEDLGFYGLPIPSTKQLEDDEFFMQAFGLR